MENKCINEINEINGDFSQYDKTFDFNNPSKRLNAFNNITQKASDITDRKKASDVSASANVVNPQDRYSKDDNNHNHNNNNSQGLSPIASTDATDATLANAQEVAPPISEQEIPQPLSSKDLLDSTSTLTSTLDPALTSNSIIDDQINKVGSYLNSKVSSLNNKQRKLLGYSMMGVGIILSALLIFTTFNKLEFSDVLISSSSKEALSSLWAKASSVNSQPNTNNNLSDPSSNSNAVVNTETANNLSNSVVISNLSDAYVLAEWQPITSLLASTEKRRKKAAKELGIDKGEWILACVSVGCWDCDRAALKLNQLKISNKVSKVLAITTANQTEATLWKERLGLTFEVKSVSSESFDDTGAVFLPTIIKVKNTISIGAKENLDGK